jgi:hypothetical protein
MVSLDPEPPTNTTLESSYAPLTSHGPLPPGLTAHRVAAAYRIDPFHLRPKRVLLTFGIRHMHGSAADRLRRALDNPDNRKGRGDSHNDNKFRPSLHNALYYHAKATAPGAYQRRVACAEHEVDGCIYLNPQAFADGIELERAAAVQPCEVIEPNSDNEALAVFGLAYGLLQPADAATLIRALSSLGPGFASYFGLSEETPATQAHTADESPALLPAAVGPPWPRSESFPSPSPEAGDPQIVQAAVEPPQWINPSASRETAGPSPERSSATIAPRFLGVYTAELDDARSRQSGSTAERIRCGSLAEFDAEAFTLARSAEEDAIAVYQAVVDAHRRGLRRLVDDATQRLLSIGVVVRLMLESLVDPEDVARALDLDREALDEALDTTETIRLLLEPLEAAQRPPVPEPQASGDGTTLADLRQLLSAYLATVNAAVSALQAWQDTVSLLRSTLADCLTPKPARSLALVTASQVVEVLRHSLTHEGHEDFTPLLIRVLADLRSGTGWSEYELSLLENHLAQAAMAGDMDSHQDLLSYLEIPHLRQLLDADNVPLKRHILAATFRQAIAHRHPFFFDDIWPYEQGWPDRLESVGEDVYRLLNGLQMLYWQKPGVSSVLQHITTWRVARTVDDGKEDLAGRHFAVAERRHTEEIAQALERAPSMSGLFYRLRQFSSTTYFRPLAAHVRLGRIRDVQEALAVLTQRFERGDLVSDIIQGLGDSKGLRPAHIESLSRYISTTLASVDGWVKQHLSDPPEPNGGHDISLGSDLPTHLLRLASDVTEARTTPGTGMWLGAELRQILLDIARGDWPSPSVALLGELLVPESLFTVIESTSTNDRPRWPSWLDPDPRSERSWVAHSEHLCATQLRSDRGSGSHTVSIF